MKRSTTIAMWVGVLVAAAAIVWWVGFHGDGSRLPAIGQKTGARSTPVGQSAQAATPQQGEPNSPRDANAPAEPAAVASGEPNKPAVADPNKPGGGEPNQPAAAPPGGPGEAASAKPSEPKVPEDPNDPLEAVNLKDVEMKNIVEKIAQWTGKTVIPNDEAMKQKITIYAPEKLPRSRALNKIYSALRMKGYTPEVVDDTIFIKPLSEVKLGTHPIVPPDQPLAAFENISQVVQKFFKLKNYPPAQMAEIIRPLVSEYGYVSADETTATLLVIDTVANLMRFERIITEFDVPEAGQLVTEIFEIHEGDPAEVIQILRMLMGESPDGRSRGSSYSSRGRYSPRPGSSSSGGPQGKGTAVSVIIPAADVPIILIPEAKRKWIIARGSSEGVRQIGEWIAKLDIVDAAESEVETVQIVYADTREVAQRIQSLLQDTPGSQVRRNVMIQPLEQSRQIMIFGRPDLRAMIKNLIAEVDMPAGQFLTEDFALEHADPDQIKANIEGLYETESGTTSTYSYRSYRYRTVQPSEVVKCVSYPTMGRVTVIASPENMEKIRKQIKEWDVPLDVEQVKPRIIELQNSDPVQMAELMTRLFTEESESSNALFRLLWWGDQADTKKKIVGPLYGQLTFENVPGTKKIIVISKIPQAYDVIEQLILDLDRQEMGEVPKVVVLKYADVEDLAERLNAMFNEAGTSAAIRRSARGLGDYSMDTESSSGSGQSNASRTQGSSTSPGEYRPWWSQGARQRPDEQPISNVIGRVRFIPDPRSKSILVLAPPQYHNDIRKMINELDVPGRQVMVKAIILSVDHQDLTSLGVQVASNPVELEFEENAVQVATALSLLEDVGSVTVASDMEIRTLVDLLIKTVNAKILNQQTLWTKDNEEASFFKGQQVAFVVGSTVSPEGRITSQNVDYQRVGMTLAVRPSITPEDNVDMNVIVNLSQLSGSVNSQPLRDLIETETNMIVQDGQTLMLGGMLFQQDRRIVRKLPLLGDLPLLGPFFRHYDNAQINNELIIFITPYVMGDDATLSAEAVEEIAGPKRRLGEARQELNRTAERLKGRLEKR